MTRHDPAFRFAALLLASGLLLLIAPAATLAHSELEKPTPADKSTVTTPVLQVSGTFTESIKVDGSKLLVKNASGATVAQGGVDPGDDKVMTASPTDPLANGAYTVEWTTISADDGDVARGTWTFTVAVAATPSATATPAASASAAPTVAPTPTAAPTSAPAPSPSGSGSDTSGSDVILPIVIALIVLGAGAVYLLSRRGRPTPSA
jgi:methionine-rich copper-binding protein CopC